MKSTITTISIELDILDDKLKHFGRIKCKHRSREHLGKCEFFADAGESFYRPGKCCIRDCPLLNE
jgi:hypothetical protein